MTGDSTFFFYLKTIMHVFSKWVDTKWYPTTATKIPHSFGYPRLLFWVIFLSFYDMEKITKMKETDSWGCSGSSASPAPPCSITTAKQDWAAAAWPLMLPDLRFSKEKMGTHPGMDCYKCSPHSPQPPTGNKANCPLIRDKRLSRHLSELALSCRGATAQPWPHPVCWWGIFQRQRPGTLEGWG